MEGVGVKYIFGKQLKGWLRQSMGVIRGWHRRYFVLDSGRLTCLTKEDDILALKTYILKDCELKDYPKSGDCCFDLISETGESVILRAANEEERKEWVKALRYVIYGDTGGGVFGVPLEDLMKYESKEARTVPYIVEACVKHVEINGKETEGIFRLPGRANMVKELRGKFEAGYRPVMDSVDVHTVGSLLKAYLRDLPESLVPPSFYQKAMNFALRYSDAKTEELQTKELSGLSKLLKELPSASYATLAYICQFLKDLSANAEKTKMDSHNLSLVFGPNLIRHMDDNPQLMMVTTDLTQQLAYMLIHHCDLVFSPMADQANLCEGSKDDPDPVMREKKSKHNVPTADLLHLNDASESQSSSPKAKRPAALCDLMDVDFNVQPEDQYPDSPGSPLVVINDYFGALSLGARDNKEMAPASSEINEGTGSLDTGSASRLGVGAKPIPPKRTKSKTFRRNQKISDSSGLSPSKKDVTSCENVVLGSSSFSIAQNLGDDKTDESVFKYNIEVGMSTAAGNTNSCDVNAKCYSAENREKKKHIRTTENDMLQTGGSCDTLATNTADDESEMPGMEAVTMRHSRTELEAEVLRLKTELVSFKSQYDCQVSELKSQLNSARSTFEERIAAMEKEHAIEMKDLNSRLAVEKKARIEAVDNTVNLQAQLYQYKLQYGEI